ncbi:MAG: DUF4139 domain-containing protein [Spirochaetia bacterium]|nr:DUF4139 domain-containing protein [Spirochaetia bacterium]
MLTQKGSDMTHADVRLSSYAFVKNQTGEDWEQVNLLFSAADPDESARIPELSEWRIKARLEERPVAVADADDSPSRYADKKSSRRLMKEEERQEPSKPANSPGGKGYADGAGATGGMEPSAKSKADLGPQDQVVQQSVETQSQRSREYYSQNKAIVKDERANKKAVAAEQNINDIRSNLYAQKSAMGRGDYEQAIESGERIMESIRRLDPKYRKLFSDEEAETMKARNQSLRLMESRRLAGRLVSPRDSARGFDYRYAAAIPETVRSDGTLHKVMLSEKPMQATLVFEAAPVRLPTAFLTGRVQLKGDAPLLSGPVSVFHNTDYTGESMITSVSSGELFRLHLGSDEDIRITRNEEEFRETSGVFSKNYNFSRKITISVKNGKKKPVTVDIFDRTPYSADDRISVTDVNPAPKADEQTRDGFLRFRLNLAPGEQKQIVVQYRLSHPSDVLPIYSETGGPQW